MPWGSPARVRPGRGDARVAPPCPTTLCGDVYLTLYTNLSPYLLYLTFYIEEEVWVSKLFFLRQITLKLGQFEFLEESNDIQL